MSRAGLRGPLQALYPALLVGGNLTGERHASIETQVRDGDKRGVPGLVSKIEAARDASLVTGVADPDQARIEHCARMACIHSEIMRRPMAYNSLVGDLGSSLSGGQRQRIFLARALYKRPTVLLLDEATSHLDHATEQAISATLRSLPITRIVVAHRQETISMADRVIAWGHEVSGHRDNCSPAAIDLLVGGRP